MPLTVLMPVGRVRKIEFAIIANRTRISSEMMPKKCEAFRSFGEILRRGDEKFLMRNFSPCFTQKGLKTWIIAGRGATFFKPHGGSLAVWHAVRCDSSQVRF